MIALGPVIFVVVAIVIMRLGRTARATERMARATAPRSAAYKLFNNILGAAILLLIVFVVLSIRG